MGINTTAERACYDAFVAAAESIYFEGTHITRDQVEDFLTNIRGVLNNEANPSEYFDDFINNGSFKECYHSGLPGWVIKWCTECNDTNTERALIEAAERYDLKPLFLPTYFIHLPFTVQSTYIDADGCGTCKRTSSGNCARSGICEECPNWHEEAEWQRFNAVQLQPLAVTCHDYHNGQTGSVHNPNDYQWTPVIMQGGTEMPFGTFHSLDAASTKWIQDVVNYHGNFLIESLARFIADFGISDLHDYNIGYYGECPVILDWLSDHIR